MDRLTITEELTRKFHEFRETQRLIYTRREFEVNMAPLMVSTIVGSRRSGKSFRLLQVIDDFIQQGVIPSVQHVCYVDFDNPVLALVQHQQLSTIPVHFMKMNSGFDANTPILFVFDEIQKIDHWEQFVIELSRNRQWKVFVTGSSSRMLHGDISTALRGKAITTQVLPFSFREFLLHCHIDSQSRSAAGVANILRHFDEYLRWGGFPIMMSLDERMRTIILKEYFDTMLLKDIIERYNVSKPQQCIYLLRYLLSNMAKPFTMTSAYNALKATGLSSSKDSVSDYINWACDSFLCYTIPIFSGSMKEQTRNYSKLYCVDWALSSVNNWVWDGMHTRSLENMVFIHLLRSNKNINYLLTRDKRQEIDFVVSDNKGKVEQLIQVSWSLSAPEVMKRECDPLPKAMSYFGLSESYVLTMNESDEIVTNTGTIKIVPVWKWLLDPMK